MRFAGLLLLAVAAFVSTPALADVYNLNLTLTPFTGAVQCKPYLNGAALAVKPCSATPQAYPGVIPTEGTYSITYAGITASGKTEGPQSDVLSVTIEKTPPKPPNPPGFTVRCRDAAGADVACPPSILITSP